MKEGRRRGAHRPSFMHSGCRSGRARPSSWLRSSGDQKPRARPLAGVSSLDLDVDELNARRSDRLEAVELLAVVCGEHVLVEEGVDNCLLGEEVLGLAPLLLRGVTVELERVFEEGLECLEALRICLLPEGALLGPDVVAVPPREDDARIGAEDRGVAGG